MKGKFSLSRVNYGLHILFLTLMVLNIVYLMSKLGTDDTKISEHVGVRVARDNSHRKKIPDKEHTKAKESEENLLTVKKTSLQETSVKTTSKARIATRKVAKPFKWVDIEARSHKTHIYVSIDGVKVYELDSDEEKTRGIHVVVLNQNSGKLMGGVVFDFYGGATDSDLAKFLDSLRQGRLIVFIVKDDGSHGLKKIGRNSIKSYGSRLIYSLDFRDHWACIARKHSGWAVENIEKRVGIGWSPAVKVRASIMLDSEEEKCEFGTTPVELRRKAFCENYEGYDNTCKCDEIQELYPEPKPLLNNRVGEIPVVIIASTRSRYLFRMLRKLLSVPGANPAYTTVYIDGFHNETFAVANLFGVKSVRNDIGCIKNCRIQQHYKKSLTHAFDAFPEAKAVIILEEDLEVAIDFFDYFNQMMPLIETDPSLYCVSAWNDLGYKHSVGDPALLYRVETMPGLGWMLKRSLFKNELEQQWPKENYYWDWDIWMRGAHIRKNRECIVPDVSRTFHFGAVGLNVGMYFQEIHFKNRKLNDQTGIKFDIEKVRKENYEEELKKVLKNAIVLNYTQTSCKNQDDFIPNTTGKTYLLFIKMGEQKRYDNWLRIATCFKIWDLDMRDFHYGLVRFWSKGNQVVVVGVPNSNYAQYKPKDITPVEIIRRKKLKKN